MTRVPGAVTQCTKRLRWRCSCFLARGRLTSTTGFGKKTVLTSKTNPLVGGVFFRTCVDEEWFNLQSESVGVSTVNRFKIWSQSTCWAEMEKVCGINCFSRDQDFGELATVWKTEIQKLEVRGAVLAGGGRLVHCGRRLLQSVLRIRFLRHWTC